jgi:hypothetical protein
VALLVLLLLLLHLPAAGELLQAVEAGMLAAVATELSVAVMDNDRWLRVLLPIPIQAGTWPATCFSAGSMWSRRALDAMALP